MTPTRLVHSVSNSGKFGTFVRLAILVFHFALSHACQAVQQTDSQHSILERTDEPATGQQVAPADQQKSEIRTRTHRPQQTVGNIEPDSVDAGDAFNELITRLVLDAIPHSYTSDRDWGGQARRWDGVRFRRDEGGRLETKRRWKMVNHGTWRKYSASLVNPEEEYSVEVLNIHQADNGKLAFDVNFASEVRFDARQSRWRKGVQMYSFSAEGHGSVRLAVHCEVEITPDITRFPPDLIFAPTVTQANIVVDEFRIDRVSKLGGEFAQQVTRAVRDKLDEKVAEKEQDLVEKINRKLSENSDKMRLSIADSLDNPWADEARDFLPLPVRQAIGNQQDR